MLSKFLITLAASASGALAATPAGFEPGSETGLLVTFGNVEALDGVVVAKDITQEAPTIATQSKLDGTSFAVLMIDLDIPTDNPPETNTLLHWLQTGLTQSSSAASLKTTQGSASAFVFSVPEDEAFASYIGPAPPARIPLSHRYTEIVVDTSDVSDEGLAALKSAAATRLGFNALSVLTSAGLADKVVAGNFFNVTNAGPVSATTASNSTGGGNGTNPSSPSNPPSQVPISAAVNSQQASVSLLAIVMGAIAFFTL
ncbi:phosphatidylethanolamine-binding protein [Xylaria cf. heliscus]|nr:phosphatidylethanolamine-binding protein [Xylaria cf. heliscus]